MPATGIGSFRGRPGRIALPAGGFAPCFDDPPPRLGVTDLKSQPDQLGRVVRVVICVGRVPQPLGGNPQCVREPL